MITIRNEEFSVRQICESGQCFRLEDAGNGIYELTAGDRYLKIRVEKDEKSTEECTVLECTEEEYESFWKAYFDLDASYADYISKIDESDSYLLEAAAFGKGIRILRQDMWEMIITFIISQQNNIPRIKKLIQTLSRKYGRQMRNAEGNVYYTFPEAENLAKVKEEELRKLKFGYRGKYICGTAKMIAEGVTDLEAIKKLEYKEARRELMKLPGIGGKVADCICLFSLHQMDAFPVDTHIQKVLETRYPQGFPFERYTGCAGVMQQYIFYYDLNKNR